MTIVIKNLKKRQEVKFSKQSEADVTVVLQEAFVKSNAPTRLLLGCLERILYFSE
jgi:hypothetical protein